MRKTTTYCTVSCSGTRLFLLWSKAVARFAREGDKVSRVILDRFFTWLAKRQVTQLQPPPAAQCGSAPHQKLRTIPVTCVNEVTNRNRPHAQSSLSDPIISRAGPRRHAPSHHRNLMFLLSSKFSLCTHARSLHIPDSLKNIPQQTKMLI